MFVSGLGGLGWGEGGVRVVTFFCWGGGLGECSGGRVGEE